PLAVDWPGGVLTRDGVPQVRPPAACGGGAADEDAPVHGEGELRWLRPVARGEVQDHGTGGIQRAPADSPRRHGIRWRDWRWRWRVSYRRERVEQAGQVGPPRWLLLQAGCDQRAQRPGDALQGGRLRGDVVHDRREVVGIEGTMAGRGVRKHAAEGEDVAR